MIKSASRVLGLIALSLIFNAAAFAQAGMSNARSMGMGGAYTALATGVESPSWNPANLALSSKKKYRLNLFSFGLGLHNNSFSKKQYDLYNGKYLTAGDKLEILNSIPAEGLQVDFDTEVQVMGIAIGNFAVTASGLAASDFSLSKDMVDLVLNGNELDRAYEVGATSGEAFGISSFAFSAGFPLNIFSFKEFTVGASVKYLKGFAYANVREATANFTTDINGVHGSGQVSIDQALGGSGMAFDLGAAAQLNETWTVSVGMLNFVNYINWNKDTERFTYSTNFDSLLLENTDDATIDSVFKDNDDTFAIDPFTTSLPQQLRIGVARTTGRLTLAVDVVQGLKKGAGASTTTEFALGSELRLIGFLPLRAGISVGGKNGLSTSAGFGLDFSLFSWDFAVTSRGGAFSGNGVGVAFDWMFRF